MTIREALLKDAEEIIDIYRPYVLETAITFEYEVPAVEEMEKRIREREGRYPFLVAEENGRVLGYAYLSPFKERSAYDWLRERLRRGLFRSVHLWGTDKRGKGNK